MNFSSLGYLPNILKYTTKIQEKTHLNIISSY